MQEFLQLVVSGIATGGIFASLALALVLIYNAMGLVNFAQGEMAMFATFLAYALVGRGMSFWIAFPVTLVLAFGAGILVQRAVIKPVERAPVLTLVIVTLGLATLINGLAGFIWGYVPRSFPSPFSPESVDLGGVFISYRGLRLIPHDPALPPTYFNPDGSVDLVNKGLYLDDVMSHMERIAAALGCQLEWDF